MTMAVFGLLYFPSPRAAAYMQVLAERQCLPEHVVIMQSDRLQRAIEIIDDHPLANQFFDLHFNIEQFCITHNLPYTNVACKDINSLEISSVLTNSSVKHWIFSGGGILKSPLFSLGKQFWHWHPGDLPEVKGSTCFYYSLLHNQQLIVSAFRMNDQIDAGEPQKRSSFRLNIHPDHLTTAFMDVVVDPWVRALSLQHCLQKACFFDELPSVASHPEILRSSLETYSTIEQLSADPNSTTPPLTDRPCYIIHPLLRWLAIEKVNAQYDENQPETITLI